MAKQRISYVPIEKMDAAMQEEMRRCQREGTPRPESQAIRARRERIAHLLGDLLEQGAASGALRKVDPVLGPTLLIGMVWGATLNHAHEVPAEVLAGRVTDLALHGLLLT